MVYYLGRDVKVYIANESTDSTGTYVHNTNLQAQSSGTSATKFAGARSAPMDAACQATDLTAVDLGIGAQDEDVTFMGLNSVLKAEVKKETTLTLTRKKLNAVWDVLYNGDGKNTLRWGHYGDINPASDAKVYTGKEKPTQQYGYRIHIQLKASGEIFCIRNAVMSAHSTSLSADGITEETMEFVSHVDPKIVTAAHTTLTPEADL